MKKCQDAAMELDIEAHTLQDFGKLTGRIPYYYDTKGNILFEEKSIELIKTFSDEATKLGLRRTRGGPHRQSDGKHTAYVSKKLKENEAQLWTPEQLKSRTYTRDARRKYYAPMTLAISTPLFETIVEPVTKAELEQFGERLLQRLQMTLKDQVKSEIVEFVQQAIAMTKPDRVHG